jgi:hypothetical protein
MSDLLAKIEVDAVTCSHIISKLKLLKLFTFNASYIHDSQLKACMSCYFLSCLFVKCQYAFSCACKIYRNTNNPVFTHVLIQP